MLNSLGARQDEAAKDTRVQLIAQFEKTNREMEQWYNRLRELQNQLQVEYAQQQQARQEQQRQQQQQQAAAPQPPTPAARAGPAFAQAQARARETPGSSSSFAARFPSSAAHDSGFAGGDDDSDPDEKMDGDVLPGMDNLDFGRYRSHATNSKEMADFIKQACDAPEFGGSDSSSVAAARKLLGIEEGQPDRIRGMADDTTLMKHQLISVAWMVKAEDSKVIKFPISTYAYF